MNPDAYLTRAQALMVTGAIGVSPDTIKKWRARGWLDPAGKRRQLGTKPGGGATLLYRLGDLLEAERDTRMSGQSRRGARRTPDRLLCPTAREVAEACTDGSNAVAP